MRKRPETKSEVLRILSDKKTKTAFQFKDTATERI